MQEMVDSMMEKHHGLYIYISSPQQDPRRKVPQTKERYTHPDTKSAESNK